MTVNATSCTCMSSHLSCQGALSGGVWVHILDILDLFVLSAHECVQGTHMVSS